MATADNVAVLAALSEQMTATVERQDVSFRRQLKQLHKFVDIQQQLTGINPLTGEVVEKSEAQKQVENFEKRLSAVMDSDSAIANSDKVANFLKLMQGESNDSSKKLLIMVLGKTKEKTPCLARFVKSDGLAVLNAWLVDANQAERVRTDLIMQILKLLPSLPVTLRSLKDSAIGKTVNKISKSKR
eukprot:SAG31_NODE_15361_length_759_cov_0.654545_1_plen_185_part_01